MKLLLSVVLLVPLQWENVCVSGSDSDLVQCREEERMALLHINASMSIPINSLDGKWEGKECCRWERVTCHPSTGHVTQLDLGISVDDDDWFDYYKRSIILNANLFLASLSTKISVIIFTGYTPCCWTTTLVEEHLDQPNELVERLVTVEEIQEPDDDCEVNTLIDELKTETKVIENSLNSEEDFVVDFPILTGHLANFMSMEVRYNFMLQTKYLSLTNNEILMANYNDPFLQPNSKPLTIEASSSLLISRDVQRKNMCRKPNSKVVKKN